jgi:VanZ family protein
VLIVYGSLYPFDFTMISSNQGAVATLLQVDPFATSRGDILANMALFLPFGLFSVVDITTSEKTFRRWALALLPGMGLAVALQVMQLYLPSRDPNLSDAVWNGMGLLLGSVIGGMPSSRRMLAGIGSDARLSVPALLIAAWLAYRLFPFVPALDVQVLKDSLKPLLREPVWSFLGSFNDCVAWLIVFHLAESVSRRAERVLYLMMFVTGVFIAEIGIVQNGLSVDNVTGAVAAITVHWIGRRRVSLWASGLLVLALARVVLAGLAPFELRALPMPFQWVPFADSLNGNMLTNIPAISEKVFFYGSLFWLLRASRCRWLYATLLPTSLLALIEVAQMRFAHHTPESTDPLLFLLLACSVSALSSETSMTQQQVRPEETVVVAPPQG